MSWILALTCVWFCLAWSVISISHGQAQEGEGLLHHNIIKSEEAVTLQAYAYDMSVGVDTGRLTFNDEPIPLASPPRRLNQDPFHLIILYDASGSMRPTAREMREQADALLNQLPSNAQIAIYRFSDNVVLEEPFSPRGEARSDLMSTIEALQPTTNATCLYDALSHVITAAGNVAPNTPRRAVLVLTDGRDEKTQGQDDACSQKNEADIVNQATGLTPPLPIYTLGFQGSEPANEDGLVNLAAETGGRFSMEDGTILFDELVDYFANQWLIETELFPPPGDHFGEVVFVTLGGSDLTRPFSFSAERDYRPIVLPPERLEVRLLDFRYLPRTNQYEAEIFFSNPSLARNFLWQIEVTNMITPSRKVVRILVVSDIQPQSVPPFLNTADNDPQPVYPYSVEIRPASATPADIDLVFGDPFIWTAPPLPQIDMDVDVEGFQNQQLLITYTLSSPQYVDTIEGYVWGVNSLSTPYVFTRSIESEDFVVTEVITPIDIGNNFGVYSITTYLQRDDAQYLNIPPLRTSVDNTFWARFTGWLFAILPNSLLLAGLFLIPILLILLGIYLIARARQNRPLLPPPVPAEPLIAQQAANTSVFRVVASPDKSQIGQPIPIDEDLFYIGREGCHLNLEDDRQISRRHVAIERKEDGFYVTDLNSRNGTFLEGKRIKPNQRYRIDGEPELRLGASTRLKFG